MKAVHDGLKIRKYGQVKSVEDKIKKMDEVLKALPELLLIPDAVLKRNGGMINNYPVTQHPDFSLIFDYCMDMLFQEYPFLSSFSSLLFLCLPFVVFYSFSSSFTFVFFVTKKKIDFQGMGLKESHTTKTDPINIKL